MPIDWSDTSTHRWLAHRTGPGDWGHWQRYELMPNDHPSEIPDPPFIAAIDTRKSWCDPNIIEYPWKDAWDHLAEAGKL